MPPEALRPATLEAILQHCPVGALTVDGRGRTLWANAALADLVGQAPERLVGLTANGALPPELQALLGAETSIQLTGGDGGVRHLQRTRIPLEAGGAAVELHYFIDETERLRLSAECAGLRRELEALRLQEPETGLMSRRALMLVLEPQVSRSRRYENPLALALLQAEFAAGREPEGARAVGQLLRDQLRWADLVGRDDDGSFVLVLPETDRGAAIGLTDKLAAALARDERIGAVFFGVTEWNRTDNAAGLLQRARSALDQARREPGNGRAAL